VQNEATRRPAIWRASPSAPDSRRALDRKKFEAACGKATNSWKQLGAVVTISGVGFWDKPHTQNPHAPNFAILAKAGLLPAGWHHRYIGPARLQAGRGWHREIATTG
jgi:hypothetical protein